MNLAYEYKGNLYISLTSRCPNKCTFCDKGLLSDMIGTDLVMVQDPKVSEIIDALNLFKGKKFGEVVFCGVGEPLFRLDDLLQLVKWLKANIDAPIRINTSGVVQYLYPDRDIALALKKVGIDKINISLNAVDSVSYDQLCKPVIENAFDALIEFIKEIRDAGISLKVSFIKEKVDIYTATKLAEDLGVEVLFRKLIR